MSAPYTISEHIHFRDRCGVTREGRVVGRELIDNPRAGRIGWTYLVRTADDEWHTVHGRDVVGIVVQPTELSVFS